MSDIETLDQRIREGAQEKLRQRIKQAQEPIFHLLRWSSANVERLYCIKNGETVPADPRFVLKALTDHLFAENVAVEERVAIEDFMQRVESLQEQVNELRSLSHEHE